MVYYLKVFFGVLLSISFLTVCLLGPALTMNWPDAVTLIFIYVFLQFSCVIFMIIYAPKSLKENCRNT